MQPMPNFKKVERAQVIIQDGQELHLKKCAECQTEFYGDEKQTNCEDCRKRRKKRIFAQSFLKWSLLMHISGQP
jgi:Zn finger protein HypA/HybF involved in hydrogenase expression